ncbi:MAG: hypothetical protein PVSMB8_17650 [Vulcanimicrobiaceae bacterium]
MRRSEGDAPGRVVRLRADARELVAQLAARGAQDPSIIERARRLLAPLAEDDRARVGDLTATLRAYYACGCSISGTAEAMFLHRNSVRYRLDRVRAILNLDIDDPANVAALLSAFAVAAAAGERASDASERA